jgi:hypothetical protein
MLLALGLLALLGLRGAAPAAGATVAELGPTRIIEGGGRIVPIPASIPHEPGDRIDRRLIANLRYLAQRFPIFVTDGYAGAPHAIGGEHPLGLAVDIVPLHSTPTCTGWWGPVTRLARWAEPQQDKAVTPFRWVGYDGDAGHGCGHHLHLSWNHAPAKPFQVADWVEVFRVSKRFRHGSGGVPAGDPGAIDSPPPSGGVGPGD